MKYLPFFVLLLAILITAGCVGGNKNSAVTPTPEVVYVTVLVTPTPTIVLPTTTMPIMERTAVHAKNENQQSSSSDSNNLMTLIPVVPAISTGNEPSVAEKAKNSTVSYAQNFAYAQAKQHGMTITGKETRPLINTFTDQDSKLELTNRDTHPHVYYVEVDFYNGATKLITDTGQWKNNGFSWFVEPGQTVRAEIIPPDNATSYVINHVAITEANGGMFFTGYDLLYT
jgi:hypothetical protein